MMDLLPNKIQYGTKKTKKKCIINKLLIEEEFKYLL